jgi:hypothetical protein
MVIGEAESPRPETRESNYHTFDRLALSVTPYTDCGGEASLVIESLKILAMCIFAAVLYGISHDQITARVCLEYFTVFHPPVFATQSPTLLGLGWGIIATWWVGAFLGILLAIAARAGSKPKLSATTVCKPVGKLLFVMAGGALLAGSLGFYLTQRGVVFPPEWISADLSPAARARFMADWWAHNASYALGIIGGITLCVLQYRRRVPAQGSYPKDL